MKNLESQHHAQELQIKDERADLVIRMTHICAHLTRAAFEQLIDTMMVIRSGEQARLALDAMH